MSAPATRDVEMEETMALISRVRLSSTDREPHTVKKQTRKSDEDVEDILARMRVSEDVEDIAPPQAWMTWGDLHTDALENIASYLDDKDRARLGRANKEALAVSQEFVSEDAPWIEWRGGAPSRWMAHKFTHAWVLNLAHIASLPSTVTHVRIEGQPDDMWPAVTWPHQLLELDLSVQHLGNIGVGWIPEGLQKLTFRGDDSMPSYTRRGRSFYNSLGTGVLPATLHTLVFESSIRSIQPLTAKSPVHNDDPDAIDMTGVVLPRTLHTLEIRGYYDAPIGVDALPGSLRVLDLGIHFNRAFAVGILPEGLHTLKMGSAYARAFGVGVLPSTLHTLVVWNRTGQLVRAGVLPESLRRLVLGCFHRLGPGVLPSKLEHLTIHSFYDDSPLVLPDTLQTLDVPKYAGVLRHVVFPRSLHTIRMPRDGRLDGITIPAWCRVVRS